jgi:hypothetical protein
MSDQNDNVETPSEFEQAAAEERLSFAAEFWDFLKHNKKWWLLPILIVVGILGLLVFLAGTGLAPFLYPVF